MTPIKHISLDCQTFVDAFKQQYPQVEVRELENLTGKVPHVGFGGASKSYYLSPKSGRAIYVLERNGQYAPDAYNNDVWQFREDFTAEEAAEFLKGIDK